MQRKGCCLLDVEQHLGWAESPSSAAEAEEGSISGMAAEVTSSSFQFFPSTVQIGSFAVSPNLRSDLSAVFQFGAVFLFAHFQAAVRDHGADVVLAAVLDCDFDFRSTGAYVAVGRHVVTDCPHDCPAVPRCKIACHQVS